jgi:hypothetical protein
MAPPHHAGGAHNGAAVGSATSSGLDVADVHRLERLTSLATMERYTKHEEPKKGKRSMLRAAFDWWAAWSVPGLGMFSEAYIIFSIGLIKPFQQAMHPTCFKTHESCSFELVRRLRWLALRLLGGGRCCFGGGAAVWARSLFCLGLGLVLGVGGGICFGASWGDGPVREGGAILGRRMGLPMRSCSLLPPPLPPSRPLPLSLHRLS